MSWEKAACEAVGVSPLGRKSGGCLRTACRSTQWIEIGSGGNCAFKTQSSPVRSVDDICPSAVKAEILMQWGHLDVEGSSLGRAGNRGIVEILPGETGHDTLPPHRLSIMGFRAGK